MLQIIHLYATNEAGSLRISDGSRIVGAVKSSGQILVWTDTSLHGIQFVGTPFTFGLETTRCKLWANSSTRSSRSKW
jgi:hypothetical protein